MLEGVKRIGHLGIGVRDLDRSVDFYCDALGLSLTERFEYPADEVGHGVAVRAGAFLRCDSTHHCLSIFAFKNEVIDPGFAAIAYGLHHIAFEIATPEQLIARYRDFKARGIEIVNAREGGPGNQPRFYARDPDGNLLEFYWGIDEIGWDGRAREYQPISEIDLEDFDFERFIETRELAADPAGRSR